eukprot:NODE_65_length_23997_cov_0.327601.p10 type:complete len:262 gc:universal NODE_65_length_23997_cov_0.327601:16889-16104(-)
MASLFRRIFKLEGKDAVPFINSLTTNTLSAPLTYLLFLTPKSRVICDAFYYQGKCSYLEVHDSVADLLLMHIQKYKLRSDVHLLPVHGQVQWHKTIPTDFKGDMMFKDPRPLMGYRSLSISKMAPIISCDDHKYTVFRYRSAVPESVDYPNSLPFDLNFDALGSISYSKGCYTGQELVIRTKHTGIIRKRTISFKINNVSSHHDLVNMVIKSNSNTIGKVINHCQSGHCVYGLALIKLDHFHPMAKVLDIPIELTKPSYLP